MLFFVYFTLDYVFSYYVLGHIIPPSNSIFPILQSSFGFVVAGTLIVTSFFVGRFDSLKMIYTSSVITAAITVLLFLIPNELVKIFSVLFAGVFFGIGQLAFFTYFWNKTYPEERGRAGGLIGFICLPFYFILIPMVAETLDLVGSVILAFVLSLGTLLVIFIKPEKKIVSETKAGRESYPEKRTILYYSIPWFLFSFINATLARNISYSISLEVTRSSYLLFTSVQVIAAVFGALGGGIIADFFGRRLTLALSLTLYGISTALAGIVQNNAVFYFVYAANGLSWGMLLTLYSFVIWGDLANKKNCGKMYSLGLTTFYLTASIGPLLTQISQLPLVMSSLIGCVMIFLSNVPVALAPELLSSDFRNRIRLRLHMNALRKIKREKQN